MSIEAAIFSLLTTDSSVSSLVGTRLYPLLAPQDAATPFIVYQRVSASRWTSLEGPSGMAQPRIQIDAYTSTYAAAKTLATAIREKLSGYRGTVAGTRIGGITLITDQDLIENEKDPKLYRVSMDFMVTHDE